MLSKFFESKDSQIELLLHPPTFVVEGLDEGIAEQRDRLSQRDSLLWSEDERFTYGALLISHTSLTYVREGLAEMEKLLFSCWNEFERLREPSSRGKGDDDKSSMADRRRLVSYFLYISIARCKLGDWDMAHSTARRLLEVEPADRQGLALVEYVEHMQTREGLVGLAGLAGLTVAAGAGAAAIALLGVRYLRGGK